MFVFFGGGGGELLVTPTNLSIYYIHLYEMIHYNCITYMAQLIYACDLLLWRVEAQKSRTNRFQVFTRNFATMVFAWCENFESVDLPKNTQLDLWAPGTSTANICK